jgi:hypothetical protein
MFTIFLGGISIHVSQALVSHFLGIDMVWGATSKEAERVNFGEEITRIFVRFKGTFVFCFGLTAMVICGVYVFPDQWKITSFWSIYPVGTVIVSHFCLPVFLNPALMMFTW